MSNDYETPFDDDFEMPNAKALDMTPEKIEQEARKSFPAGFQTLIVRNIEAKTDVTQKVVINGEPSAYETKLIVVSFVGLVPGHERVMIKDKFHAIPLGSDNLKAYQTGTLYKDDGKKVGGENAAAGYECKKLQHFLNALGYNYPPLGMLPEDARKLRNWLERKINAEIRSPEPWTTPQGKKMDGMPMLRMFSYKRYEGVDVLPGADDSASGPPPTVSRPAAPVKVPDAVNIDDI